MKLREILPSDAEIDARSADLDIGGVTADSRTVKRGDLFVAIAGGKADGLDFVAPGDRRRRRRDRRRTAAADAAAGECRVRACRQRAARAGADRREILSAPAGDHRRRHRHQRQDVGRSLHAANLDGARPSRRQHRHHRHRLAARRNLRLADDARSGGAAPFARRAGRRGRHASRDRSVVARARSISRLDGLRIAAAASPISPAIISIIIRASKPISPPSCGCSRFCSNRAPAPSSMSTTIAPTRWWPPPRRAAWRS